MNIRKAEVVKVTHSKKQMMTFDRFKIIYYLDDREVGFYQTSPTWSDFFTNKPKLLKRTISHKQLVELEHEICDLLSPSSREKK